MTNESKDRGFLTTHVLDTGRGCPAAGIEITLFKISADFDFVLIGSGITNHDGRLPRPILSEDDFKKGHYQLNFHVSSYLQVHFKENAQNLFLEEIPIRFRISKSMEHYHVPLLLSPFGYSTYRGS